MPHISVVIPVYKAEGCLQELYRRLEKSLAKITPDFEIILVEDSGGDRSWEIIQGLAQQDPRVKGIKLSRNFGQHYAITAGIDNVKGDWVVVMDCDLQDQPEEIGKLYSKAQEGYDVVFARRATRHDNVLKKMQSRLFYKILSVATDRYFDATVANFGIYKKIVIDNFRLMREHSRLFPIFIKWVGFPTAYVDVDHAPRFAGRTSYNLGRKLALATETIISHSNKPLKLSISFGFILSFLALVFGAWLTVRYLILSIPVQGWTSLMVTSLFFFGLLFANMGVVGLYIGKIFDETKDRPLYVIAVRTSNLEGVSPNV